MYRYFIALVVVLLISLPGNAQEIPESLQDSVLATEIPELTKRIVP